MAPRLPEQARAVAPREIWLQCAVCGATMELEYGQGPAPSIDGRPVGKPDHAQQEEYEGSANRKARPKKAGLIENIFQERIIRRDNSSRTHCRYTKVHRKQHTARKTTVSSGFGIRPARLILSGFRARPRTCQRPARISYAGLVVDLPIIAETRGSGLRGTFSGIGGLSSLDRAPVFGKAHR
ncbi:hypothetical protein SAMN05443247_05085 [Bradyrhizobium erythrophlei]|jgi:hypothetical protein|nr:hypothetical protein SAMN05443247_05085 [Bradyrhizobium erythrophlei]